MTPRRMLVLLGAAILPAALSGCGASLPGLSTGSLLGGEKTAAAAAPQATNDPTSRAMQVGATAARAQKCGFNFDPVKLKTNYLAAEAAQLTTPSDAGKISQIYDTAFNGISKAVATQGESYCSEAKTRTIKEDLARHLAGDYTPRPPESQPDDSLLGDMFSGGGGGERPKWASDTLGN